MIALVLALTIGGGPSDSDLLKYKVAGKTFVSKCSVDAPGSKGQKTPAQSGWLGEVGVSGTFEEGDVSGTVWDDSDLFPRYRASDYDKQLREGAIAFAKILASAKGTSDPYISTSSQPTRQVGEGFSVVQFPQLRASILSVIGASSGGVPLGEDAVFSAQLDTFVSFESSDGREEMFQLKGARDGGDVSGFEGLVAVEGHPRLNKKLLGVTKNSALRIPRGRYSVKQLLKIFADRLSVPLDADERMMDTVLFIDPSGDLVSVRDLLLGVADSLDMYWKDVRGSQVLSISPEKPETLFAERYQLKTAHILAPLLARASQLGLTPYGLSDAVVMSPGYRIGSVSPDCMKSIFKSIVFRTDLDQQRWEALSQDRNYQEGKLHFRVMGTSNVSSESGHYSAGGLTWRLDGNF